MCGIIGVISKNQECNSVELIQSLKTGLEKMAYRGPDHVGTWHDNQVYFGHRRLSIIDLSADGNQPFSYQSDRYILVFNGEIYNYLELKKKLVNLGYSFHTQTDTEVIIASYIHFGNDFCRELRGMFAFVLYDREERKVVFGRDRLGKKPLFILENDNLIVFSSEIKFFHTFQGIDLQIDENSLLDFLSLQYIPAPQTIYKGVRQLKPAEIFTWDLTSKTATTHTFWNMFDFVGHAQKEPELDEIEELLEKSIRYRLVANVDIGLLLSGGIDSSLLAGYMQQLAGNKVKAFNVGFNNKALDESGYAKKVAGSLDMDLITLNLEDINCDNFIQSIFHADQPLGDSAIIPTYLIAKAIGKHVKVVLSGEGADELFHGYDHYRYEKYYYRLGKSTFKNAELFAAVISKLGISQANKLYRKLSSINSFSKDPGTARWTSILSPALASSYMRDVPAGPGNWDIKFNSYLHQFHKNAGMLESSLMLDLMTWLPDDLLVKTDRMMMARSVEARTPFLDHELVERILSSSGQFNVSNFQNKNYLRKLLLKKLPHTSATLISKRPKQGFETPKIKWMTDNLSEIANHLFSADNLKENPYLRPDKIQALWEDLKHKRPGTNYRLAWNVFCFLEWHRQHENKFGL